MNFFILALLFVDLGGGSITVRVRIAGASTAVVPQEMEETDEKAYGYGAADTGAKRLVAQGRGVLLSWWRGQAGGEFAWWVALKRWEF